MSTGKILILLTAVISGVSIFLNQFGISGIDPTLFAGFKNLLVGGITLLIILATFSLQLVFTQIKRYLFRLLTIAIIGGAVPFILFFNGLAFTTASQGAFIHKLMFVVIAVLAIRFLKEKLTTTLILAGLVIIIANVLLLNVFTNITFGYGDILVGLATVLWAIENTMSKSLLNKGVSALTIILSRMLFGGLLILGYFLFMGKGSLISQLSINQWWWIYLTSLMLLGYVFTWYNGIKHYSLIRSSLILALGSPITTILSTLFLFELPDATRAIGTFLILVTVGVIILTDRKEFTL